MTLEEGYVATSSLSKAVRRSLAAVCMVIVFGATTLTSGAVASSRTYELVTPPDTNGIGVYAAVPFTVIQGAQPNRLSPAAPDGNSLIYQSDTPLPGTNASRAASSTGIAVRTPAGWTSRDPGVPRLPDGVSYELSSFAGDLTRITAEASNFGGAFLGETPAAPRAASLSPDDPGGPAGLVPPDFAPDTDLYTQSAGEFGSSAFEWVTRSNLASHAQTYRTFEVLNTPSNEHSVFSSEVPLDPRVPTASGSGLYIHDRGSSAPNPEVLSILPDDSVADYADFKGTSISDDGQRVVFAATPRDGDVDNRLYVRIRDESRTIDLGAAPASGSRPTLSPDGHTVIVTTPSQLDPSDTDTSEDLYAVDVDSGVATWLPRAGQGAPDNSNSDTCGSSYGSMACDINPVVSAKDGASAVFLSPQRLTASSGGIGPVENAPNLYRVSTAGGIRFLATLAPEDARDPDSGEVEDAGSRTGSLGTSREALRAMRLSADGKVLVLESFANLTSYDSGGVKELYRIDMAAGSIECVSCAGSGGSLNLAAQFKTLGTSLALRGARYSVAGRAITDDGSRVFFDTREALASADINGKSDVYEWSTATKRAVLVSGGTGSDDSYYIDSSPDGSNVFFQTSDTLVGGDLNGASQKLYDAREGGGFPATPSLPPCEGSACRGPLAPPPTSFRPASSQPAASGNAKRRSRLVIRLARPNAAALREAARSGALSVRIGGSRSATLKLVATASQSGRRRQTASTVRRVKSSRTVTARLKLNSSGRRTLSRTGKLRLTLTVTSTGARSRSVGVTLRETK